jgi:septal ring factor EnvC (AmiA/AmiB activator)
MPSARELGGEPRAPQRSSIFEPGYEVESEEDASLRPGFESEAAPSRPSGSAFAGAAPVLRAAGPESERRVEDLERRVAHLEKRLEEVNEVKDRLDRQLATQNEELRVQRAAIARTQRVLRNLSRPEDAATEPAPKGPGSQPPGGLR